MKVCFIGDIVAAPGRRAIVNALPSFLASNEIDLCIANAENSAHGLGVSQRIIDELIKCGVDVITLGNHAFSNYEFISQIGKFTNVVRPSNVSASWPGPDIVYVEKAGKKVAVINLLGQVEMTPFAEDPFTKADELVEKIKEQGIRHIILDFHAEATSEKKAMGFYLDGRASLVVGTHTHVQTADNKVLEHGTGYITDAGMTGVTDSVLGMDIETSVKRLKDKLSARYDPAEGDASINGVIAELDDEGRCISVRRFTEYE